MVIDENRVIECSLCRLLAYDARQPFLNLRVDAQRHINKLEILDPIVIEDDCEWVGDNYFNLDFIHFRYSVS